MAEYLCKEDMNTGEYISRDLALRQLNATCLATDCDNYSGVRCRACAYADAMDFIEAIPAPDVQPIRRGRWIITDDVEHFIAICSECGRTEDSRDIKNMPYCHCGARMDLKDGDAK